MMNLAERKIEKYYNNRNAVEPINTQHAVKILIDCSIAANVWLWLIAAFWRCISMQSQTQGFYVYTHTHNSIHCQYSITLQ